MVKRRVFDNEKHVPFVTFSCDKRRNFLQQAQTKRIVIGQLRPPFMNKWKDQSSHEIKKLYRSKFPKYWEQIDDADPIVTSHPVAKPVLAGPHTLIDMKARQ